MNERQKEMYKTIKEYVENNSNSKLASAKYENGKTPLVFKCDCGENYSILWKTFTRNKYKTCASCRAQVLRKDSGFSYEHVKDFVKNNSQCQFLESEYINSKTYMRFRCKCEKEFKTTFEQFKKEKRRCNDCSMQIKSRNTIAPIDDVRRYIEEESNSGCKLLSNEYNGYKDRILLRCHCGEVFNTTFAYFKGSKIFSCRLCRGLIDWNFNDVKNFIEKESNSNCKLLSNSYENTFSKIHFKCKCGIDFWTTYSEFLNQNRRQCLECGKKMQIENSTKTQKEFCDEVFSLVKDEYTVLGDYIGARHNVKMRHNQCGYEYNVVASSFTSKSSMTRCPKCNESKGEKRISQYLDNFTSFSYYTEYRIDDCRNKRPLPFDFALKLDDELLMLIEYDGEFHYERKAIGNLEQQQHNDNIKNNYCESNDILLLRIPYWDFHNIENILQEELSKYNLINIT